MPRIPHEPSSGNVFADLGFPPAEAAALTAKATLILAIKTTIERRRLTQLQAAERCGTDQPTLSKILRGRMESITIDRLATWLNALGHDIEITILPTPRSRRRGQTRVIKAA